MADFDHALNILKMHIKKEIVDNYFAERSFLEDDLEALVKEEEVYETEVKKTAPLFAAFYQLLPSPAARSQVLQLWGTSEPPLFQEAALVTSMEKQAVLDRYRPHGWTARGRLKSQIFDLYHDLQKAGQALRKKQQQVAAHCELYNEDVIKFNENFDYNLIATQVDAMEGQEMPMAGGISALERETMAAKMRLRKKVVTACLIVTLPELPPLDAIKKKLGKIIDQFV